MVSSGYKWAQLGSNQRPRSYELPALTAELWALAKGIVAHLSPIVKRVKPINSTNFLLHSLQFTPIEHLSL